MNHIKKIAPMVVLALLIAGIAWACKTTGTSATQAAANKCPYATEASHAKLTGAGSHCGGLGKSAEAMAHQCGVKAGQVMYSFAVPGADCEHCIRGIQKATMTMKGIECAHVDLSTHTAYIIAAKDVSQKSIAKAIQVAGFKNSYKGSGKKVQAAFVQAMKSGAKNGMSCCPAGKEKDKV
jgi:copper chaperone CopZ